MDSERVFTNLDYLASSGVVLSVEQKASLQSSLVILKRENKFCTVKLWGVVKGIQNRYFIVQGVGKDEIKDRTTLYRLLSKFAVWIIIQTHSLYYNKQCINNHASLYYTRST